MTANKKAQHAREVKAFTDIPNIGTAVAKDFVILHIKDPQELARCDPFELYSELCRITKVRHDPCVLDTFMAAVDFMNGAPAKPWYAYTKKRKKILG
jgi:hypothetical protein